MKRKWYGLLIACLFICLYILPVSAAGEEAAFGSSGGLNVAYHTQSEIRAFIRKTGAGPEDPLLFERNPVVSAPYDPGKLSEETLLSSVNMLNQIRYIAGLSYNVTLDESMNEYCQAGTLVNYANGQLSHYPDQPSGMSEELYYTGYTGTSRSNLSWASWSNRSMNSATLFGWMADADSYNIDRMGHRRWLLNPTLGKTGFGAVTGSKGTYQGVYVFDWSNSYASESNVAWPAQNMPVEYFRGNFPWTLSTGQLENMDAISIELTRTNDGRKWNFNAQSSDGFFNVNNDGYGEPGCVIFRPEDVDDYQKGDSYQVTVRGLVSGDVSYTVKFFSLDDSQHTHNLKRIPATNATCTTNGNMEYYCCEECGALFLDNAATVEVTDKNAVIIPASHTIRFVNAKDATCTTDGYLAHYVCEACGKIFSDSQGTVEVTNVNSWVIKAHHTIRFVSAKDATCTTDGYLAHYVCEACGKIFSDSQGAVEVTNANRWVIKAHHAYSPEWSMDDKHHWHVCTKCNSSTSNKGEHMFSSFKDTDCNVCGYVRAAITEIIVEDIFQDVEAGQWYVPFIQYVCEKEIMIGKSGSRFGTAEKLTRGEFVQVLYSLEGKPTVSYTSSFSDVNSTDWFAEAVFWANEKGIANGISQTQFAPKGNITREQAATMLKKYAEFKGYDVSTGIDLSDYPDAGDVSSWATSNISWTVANGIISGRGRADGTKLLAPQGEATRAECAAMLKSFCEKFQEE